MKTYKTFAKVRLLSENVSIVNMDTSIRTRGKTPFPKIIQKGNKNSKYADILMQKELIIMDDTRSLMSRYGKKFLGKMLALLKKHYDDRGNIIDIKKLEEEFKYINTHNVNYEFDGTWPRAYFRYAVDKPAMRGAGWVTCSDLIGFPYHLQPLERLKIVVYYSNDEDPKGYTFWEDYVFESINIYQPNLWRGGSRSGYYKILRGEVSSKTFMDVYKIDRGVAYYWENGTKNIKGHWTFPYLVHFSPLEFFA